MTSSVMRRNEQLTLLDERFEKVNTRQQQGSRHKQQTRVALLSPAGVRQGPSDNNNRLAVILTSHNRSEQIVSVPQLI